MDAALTAATLLAYFGAICLGAWYFFIDPAVLFATELAKGMHR